jgi:sulfhydrogenase subunit beta (sulfur reductase)
VTTYYMSTADLLHRVDALRGAGALAPLSFGGLPWWEPVDASTSSSAILDALRQPRAAQSAKGAMLPISEAVGRYGSSTSTATATGTTAATLIGVRACELRALAYHDKVLMGGEFDDPLYRARRGSATVVSCDCVDCAASCCCTLVGGQPYAKEGGFDVNLTPLEDGWIVEVATDKGRKVLGSSRPAEATAAQLARRDEVRRAMTERVKAQNKEFTFRADDTSAPTLPEGADDAWQRFAADCVECGACTHVCPTCYCFYLYDQSPAAGTFERVRTWDSCLLSTYHRMAGAVHMKLSPRPLLLSRLANRVLHKYVYSRQQVGLLSCVGCGRCIDACPGAIDIRKVVQELAR